MCGIAGIVALRPDARVDQGPLRKMAERLVHRGPDDEGYYVDPRGRCGLAFRRLSIIDLETGQQPITNADQTIHVAFNGEIYNFGALREELQEMGYKFRTRGDAEVIVHAYAAWGERCFEYLHGMFAIAIWDQVRGWLLLGRDRFGKKPLVYATLNNRVYFASEMKAILALPEVSREIDPQSLHKYLLFQYVPAPHSIYRHFRKVPPGHYVTIEDASLGQPQRYWSVPQPPPYRGTYEDARRELGVRVRQAVLKRLVADVPLGAFLSGGVDSSIVVAMMRQLGVSPLRTFSIGFPDERYDETRYARQVAELFETEHHEFIVTPQAREILDTLAWYYDEPFADSSAIPTYYVARKTREHVTVALTGDAGDEVFAGYDRYVAAKLAARADFVPRPVRQMMAQAARLIPHGEAKSRGSRAYRLIAALGQSPSRRYLSWVNIFTPAQLVAGLRPEFAELVDLDEALVWFDGLYENAPGAAANRAVHTDLQSYLPYDLLTKVDIASMACSLECRSPLLDHDLVEFALSLPLHWRVGRNGGKHILKDWAASFLPVEVLHRRKMGFGVPVGEWFRHELRELLEERLLAPESLCQHIFRSQWLRTLLDQHLSGHVNHAHPLWALFMLELWHTRWRPTGW
ncbi:MAG: asparagine synthase (glutamine-hydrolyzing) [Phycisphaerae bacterium]|nr:asparagine synthase (glutamine-hydrolyzing) [Phycisphaerae bacterium]